MKFRARNFLFGRPSILLLNLVLNLVFFFVMYPFKFSTYIYYGVKIIYLVDHLFYY